MRSSRMFVLEVKPNLSDQQISRSWVGDIQINQRNSKGNLSSMNMNRLRRPGHAQFLVTLCSSGQFSPVTLLCILLTKKWFERFFSCCKHGKLSPCPQRINKNNKEGTHCIMSVTYYYLRFDCACPYRIHCSRSALTRPCPSCIRSDTLHRGWNPTLEE